MSEYFVHETSCIDQGVQIGAGTRIWHFSHVLKNACIGSDCNIGQNVMLDREVVIGNRCKIQNNVSIYNGVTLEDEVFCGPSCVFTNVVNPRAFIERKDEFKPTLVRRGASIGANATILCGITLGEYSFVAAGAVVTKDVEDYALVVGAPAKRKSWICKCGVILASDSDEQSYTCSSCSAKYQEKKNKLLPISS